ncbi:MAG: hypothetical protein HRU12_04275, partial [Phaeodactylibacter sp.]|nr:hypothetical protein [Phaeodactylibacter sp.]
MKPSLCLFLLLIPAFSFAQYQLLQLNAEERFWHENAMLRETNQLHTAIRPWRIQEVAEFSRKKDLL